MLPAIEYGPGSPSQSILSAFTRATDGAGNGIDGGPLAGWVYSRAAGSPSQSWAQGVRVSMAGCGCVGGHQPDCAAPADPAGGWLTPADGEGEATVEEPDVRRLKHRNCPPPVRTFRSFPIFYPEECDTTTEGPKADRIKRLAAMGLEAYTAYILAHELQNRLVHRQPVTAVRSEADHEQRRMLESVRCGRLTSRRMV